MSQFIENIDQKIRLPHPNVLMAEVLPMQMENVEADHEQPESLKTAFDLFNSLSLQLADSYQHLEQRVADLSDELDTVSQQRYSELQQKEQLANRLETLINLLPGGVIVLDNSGIIVESNPAAEALLETDIEGKAWRDVVHRCFAPREDDGHEVSNRNGKRISIVTRSLEEDGQIILLTDQTETRQLQAKVSRKERLSALGEMVSTLAHQVRTPLASAMLYANHLSASSLSLEQRQDFTHKLLNRLNYMERQVRDMLLFVKGDVPLTNKVTLAHLEETLKEALEMPLKSYGAQCDWYSSHSPKHIQCNLDALIGALLNLVTNSLQACPQPVLTIRFIVQDNTLEITIADNGPGLSQQQQNQSMELFYTTKEQGTGIGLSVVNRVVKSHGGDFNLGNAEKGGACARLTLPLI